MSCGAGQEVRKEHVDGHENRPDRTVEHPRLAQGIRIAAAADLNAPLSEIAANYPEQTGMILKLSFGSSGNLFNQIKMELLTTCSSPPMKIIQETYRGQFSGNLLRSPACDRPVGAVDASLQFST